MKMSNRVQTLDSARLGAWGYYYSLSYAANTLIYTSKLISVSYENRMDTTRTKQTAQPWSDI